MPTILGPTFFSDGYTSLQPVPAQVKRAAQLLEKSRVHQELALTLNGVAPGQAANVTIKQVKPSGGQFTLPAGTGAVENRVELNRNTTAGDVTLHTAQLFKYDTQIAAAVGNGDRNRVFARPGMDV